jgi:hypothetical protein
MNVPEWFRAAINILDPLLRARWGSVSHTFVVERRAYISPDEIFYLKRREARLRSWVHTPKLGTTDKQKVNTLATWKDVAERLTSANDRYRIIFFPEKLNQETYNLLCESDTQRYGGYSSFFDRIEEGERAEERLAEGRLEHARQDLAHEVFGMCDFVARKKQAVVATGHKDLGMLVHGRPTGDKPLIQAAV